MKRRIALTAAIAAASLPFLTAAWLTYTIKEL